MCPECTYETYTQSDSVEEDFEVNIPITTKDKLAILQKNILEYKDARAICREVGQDTPILDSIIYQLDRALNYLTEDERDI
jgi:hypothetical protein